MTVEFTERSLNVCDSPRVPADRTGSGSDLKASSAVDVSGAPGNGRRDSSTGSTVDDRQQLRALTARLRPSLPNIDKLVRLGVVAMVERCEQACARRPDVGAGYLAQLILQGGPSIERRRVAPSSVVPAGRPCPLDHEPDLRGILDGRWREIEERVRVRLGHDLAMLWDTWMGGAHAHRVEGGIELGVSPAASAWVGRRYGRLVEQVAGCEVVYVPCEAAS